jgi:hypothetical protein
MRIISNENLQYRIFKGDLIDFLSSYRKSDQMKIFPRGSVGFQNTRGFKEKKRIYKFSIKKRAAE